MNKEYIESLEKTILRKKAELEQMYKDGAKFQHCGLLREEITRKQKTLARAKREMAGKKK
jgi:hypothetical protein